MFSIDEMFCFHGSQAMNIIQTMNKRNIFISELLSYIDIITTSSYSFHRESNLLKMLHYLKHLSPSDIMEDYVTTGKTGIISNSTLSPVLQSIDHGIDNSYLITNTSDPSTPYHLVTMIMSHAFIQLTTISVVSGISQPLTHPSYMPDYDITKWSSLHDVNSNQKDITFKEQLLIMKVIQGLCWFLPNQRYLISSGPLFPVSLLSLLIYTYKQDYVKNNMLDDQIHVLIAMVEAMESACHYSSHSLSSLIQLKGVSILLDSIKSKYIHIKLKISIIHLFSVLVNETQCYLRVNINIIHNNNDINEVLVNRDIIKRSLWKDRQSVSKFYMSMSDWFKYNTNKENTALFNTFIHQLHIFIQFEGIDLSYINTNEITNSMINKVLAKQTDIANLIIKLTQSP